MESKSSGILCDHANEVPMSKCKCEEDCACKEGTCKLVESNMTEEQKKNIEIQNKKKYATDRLKELRNLWLYLMNVHGGSTRQGRRRFRREFIADEQFSFEQINAVIKFYEVGVKSQNNERPNISRGRK